MALRLFHLHDRDDNRVMPADDSSAYESPAVLQRFAAIDGLVFDMGDVLFDATAWRRRLWQLLVHLGLHASYRSLFELWDRDYLNDVHCGRREYGEAFVSFLREVGLSAGQINELTAASPIIKRQLEADVRPFPGVTRTLARLHQVGLKLAVLSDSESPAAAIRRRLDQLGIGRYFHEVVSSVDLGRTKPDPAGYRIVLERLHLAAGRTAFVGHDADELQGAHRCGMRTIAFNAERHVSADCVLRCFDDLSSLFSGRPLTLPAERREAA